jgi:hypothetical protein
MKVHGQRIWVRIVFICTTNFEYGTFNMVKSPMLKDFMPKRTKDYSSVNILAWASSSGPGLN